MDLALIEEIFSVLVQAVKLGIQYGPELLADIEQAVKWATSGTPITAEQQTQLDATLDAAHNRLQADADKEIISITTPPGATS